MKTDFILAEVIPDKKVRSAIHSILSLDEDFATISKILGLDPVCDFQNSNLSAVDFSYSDLRGFNFTNSDLSNSYGMDITIDETTVFENADLLGSVFSKRVRERQLFERNPGYGRIYQLLKDGDTYEVSDWITSRNGFLARRQLSGINEEDAVILCKKLVVDDVDLTKRTNLFYQLRNITTSNQDMREVVSDFIAFNINEPNRIRAFIKVAGDLLYKDEFISRTMLMLCNHRDDLVRISAFEAVAHTKIFLVEYEKILETFYDQKNDRIRKRILRNTARKLSRFHERAISKRHSNLDNDLDNIFDSAELLDREVLRETFKGADGDDIRLSQDAIIKYHEEVLAIAPIFSKIALLEKQTWRGSAILRVKNRKLEDQMRLEAKISSAFRTGGL